MSGSLLALKLALRNNPLLFRLFWPRKERPGFHARVVQHEYDHLIGVMYPERMEDMTLLGFADELRENPPETPLRQGASSGESSDDGANDESKEA